MAINKKIRGKIHYPGCLFSYCVSISLLLLQNSISDILPVLIDFYSFKNPVFIISVPFTISQFSVLEDTGLRYLHILVVQGINTL